MCAHLLFYIHHINSLQADPNVDSFAFGPLENPLHWFVNLSTEESAPVCVVNSEYNLVWKIKTKYVFQLFKIIFRFWLI